MPGASRPLSRSRSSPMPTPATATSSTSFAPCVNSSAAEFRESISRIRNSPRNAAILEGKEIVAQEDYLAKIRAAVAARSDPDFTIIARTDARAVAGFDEAIDRANAALTAGADMAFVEAPQTLEEVAAVPRLVDGPCLLNMVRGGKTPDLDLREAERMGYKLAIVPALLIQSVVGICDQALAGLRETGRHPRPIAEITVPEMFRRFGADEWDALRERFRATPNS
jgi:2-methylisocitrate lyase-like PEP mutase family enzyme